MVDLSFIKGSNILRAIGLGSEFAPGSPQEVIQYACKVNQAVTMTIDGRLSKFRSVFLEMDNDGESVYMDELTPIVEDGLLRPNKTVAHIAFDMHGVGRKFRAVFVGKKRVGNHGALRFTIPDDIEKIQRRGYFRVRPRLADPVNVLFQHKELKQVTGVVDISAGGICFNSVDRIAPGIILPSVVKLPNEYEHFRVKLTTRGIDKLEIPEHGKGNIIKPFRVRAQFKHLIIADLQALDRYIMDRQRDVIKVVR